MNKLHLCCSASLAGDIATASKSLLSCKRKGLFETSNKFWLLFKTVSNLSNVLSKMTWKHSEGNIIAENNKDVVNNFFHSMFNPPFSQDEYNNHSTSSSCDLITDIHVSSDDVRRILLSLDVNKATGPDGIHPARLLGYFAPYHFIIAQ